jgi:hypothetical protein
MVLFPETAGKASLTYGATDVQPDGAVARFS